MKISEAFYSYAQDVIVFRNQSAKTQEHHNVALKSFINFVGDIPIEELTFAQVRDWKISLEKRNLSPVTVRGYLIKIRLVLNYAKTNGISCLDPQLIILPRRITRPPSVLLPSEVQLLIDSTNKVRNKALISLIYSAGLRVSEVVSMNRDDIKQDHFTILGKSGKSRLCFIDERSRKLLNDYLKQRVYGYDVFDLRTGWLRYHIPGDKNPALFTSPRTAQRISVKTVQLIVSLAGKKSGFEWPVHPHTLRHSFATNLMANGMHIYTLSRIMGHSSIQTTEIYLHKTDPQLQEDYAKYHST